MTWKHRIEVIWPFVHLVHHQLCNFKKIDLLNENVKYIFFHKLHFSHAIPGEILIASDLGFVKSLQDRARKLSRNYHCNWFGVRAPSIEARDRCLGKTAKGKVTQVTVHSLSMISCEP